MKIAYNKIIYTEVTKRQDQCSREYVRASGRFVRNGSLLRDRSHRRETVLGRYFTQLEVAL